MELIEYNNTPYYSNNDNKNETISENNVNNSIVWFVATLPFLGLILEYFYYINGNFERFMWLAILIILSISCVVDEKILRKRNMSRDGLSQLAIFLPPLYLAQRSTILKQRQSYSVLFIITLVLVFMFSFSLQKFFYSEDDALLIVKQGCFNIEDISTVEEVLDFCCTDGVEWDITTLENDIFSLTAKGTALYSEKDSDITFAFTVQLSEWYVEYIEIDGEKLEFDELEALLTTVAAEADAYFYDESYVDSLNY